MTLNSFSQDNFQANSHSDANLEIIDTLFGKFVRKKITNPKLRDKKSYQKIVSFRQRSNLRAVNTQIITLDNETLSYDMPFESGYVGADYAKYATVTELKDFSRIISDYFDDLVLHAGKPIIYNEHILAKLLSLRTEINLKVDISDKLKEISNNKITLLEKSIIQKKIFIPISECHGDFTLSNLIYDHAKKQLVLIDFLDTFCESYLSDYVKLVQDLRFGWSCRFEKSSITAKSKIIGHQILQNIKKSVKNFEYEVHILLIINILRIVPYSKDKTTDHWLCQVLGEEL